MLKHKLLDAILLALVMLAVVFFYNFISSNKELKDTVDLQALKANSLVEEIGQTKQENYELFQRLMQSQKKVEEPKDVVEYLKQAIRPSQISQIQREELSKISQKSRGLRFRLFRRILLIFF